MSIICYENRQIVAIPALDSALTVEAQFTAVHGAR